MHFDMSSNEHEHEHEHDIFVSPTDTYHTPEALCHLLLHAVRHEKLALVQNAKQRRVQVAVRPELVHKAIGCCNLLDPDKAIKQAIFAENDFGVLLVGPNKKANNLPK